MASKKERIILIAPEKGVETLKLSLEFEFQDWFPGRFDFVKIPFSRPVEGQKSASELLLKMQRQRTAALVVLVDDSISKENFEGTKPLFIGTISQDPTQVAEDLMGKMPVIQVQGGDSEQISEFSAAIQSVFDRYRERTIDALERERQNAMDVFLDGVPIPEGEKIVTEMRGRGSPLQDIPLVVMGLLPDRKEHFEKIAGRRSVVLTSDDDLLGADFTFGKIQEFTQQQLQKSAHR